MRRDGVRLQRKRSLSIDALNLRPVKGRSDQIELRGQ
jgi:hypothetical protein